eukprot:TRINITY_DN10343_c0_g1_i1.p2 TRINITY_DN10343_c0_g1~~TRINITY_DN10343_c0_g1_i1.p2  ORF type:complete len:88 (-),score=5.15 TRINITY_DN10343_c0_g1_i1:567-830(-)
MHRLKTNSRQNCNVHNVLNCKKQTYLGVRIRVCDSKPMCSRNCRKMWSRRLYSFEYCELYHGFLHKCLLMKHKRFLLFANLLNCVKQ